MSQALCFQSVEFDVIQQNQQPWVRGYQIGSALGYTAPDVQISKLYTRHADEFTPAMTAVVTLPTEGGPPRLPPPRHVRPHARRQGVPQVVPRRHRAVRRQGAR